MRIEVVTGTGQGPNELAAFDAALRSAGIANCNMLVLSSVIPPATTVEVVGTSTGLDAGWGDRLYIVLAQEYAVEPGAEAWAGLGWAQGDDGRGLFVEHHAATREAVEDLACASLGAMITARAVEMGPVQVVTAGATCEGPPVCALVAAVFESQPWSS